MNIIKDNPFRILGLPVNVTERELQKRISIIKRYTEIGKVPPFDFDMNFIGEINRNLETAVKAAAKIEQANNRIIYSLFWFINDTNIDEIALNYLKVNSIKKAYEIWKKALKDNVSANNFSSYQNISTLLLALGSDKDNFDINYLRKGVYLKGLLLQSELFTDYVNLITGEHNNNIAVIGENFSDELIDGLMACNTQISEAEIINLFSECSPNIKKRVQNKFTIIPISNIENKIEKTSAKREEKPSEANVLAEELIKNTENDLLSLKEIAGKNSSLYNMTVNKLAQEILQCSIEYYNKERGNNSKVWGNAYKTANLAREIGPNGHIKNRIEQSISKLKELEFEEYKQITELLTSIVKAYLDLKGNIDKSKVNKILEEEINIELIKNFGEINNYNLIVNFYDLLEIVAGFTETPFVKKIEKVFYNSLPLNSEIKKYVDLKRKNKREKKRKKMLIFGSILIILTLIIWLFAGEKGIGIFVLIIIIIAFKYFEKKLQ